MTSSDVRDWIHRKLTAVVTTAMGILLAAATIGTWTMAEEFGALKSQVQGIEARMDRRDQEIERAFQRVDGSMERVRRRLRYIERGSER